MIRDLLAHTMQFCRSYKAYLLPCTILLAVYLLWWLAYYPGIMTPDSLDQWRQAISHSYSDAHPFTSSLVMSFFRAIYDTPAWISLLQVIIMSGTIGLTLGYCVRRGVSKYIVGTLLAGFALWPVFGIYTVTIWKDILFSIFIVIASILLFIIIADKQYRNQRWPLICLAVIAALIALWRHNGIIYLLLPFILLWFAAPSIRSNTWKATAGTLVFYLVMHFGVAHMLNVRPAPLVAEWLRLKTVAAVYHEDHPTITPHDRKLFTDVMPESSWKTGYKCLHTDTTFAELSTYRQLQFEDSIFIDPKMEAAWKKAVVRTALHNPNAIRKDRQCVANILFGSEAGFIKYTTDITTRADLPYIEAHPLLGTAGIKTKTIEWLRWSQQSTVTNFIFWSAIPAALLSIVYFVLALRRRYTATASYALMMLASPLFVIAIGSSSDYRYIYSLVIGGPLVVALYLTEQFLRRSTSKKTSQSARLNRTR